jgi:hypothetical protein
MTIADHIRAEEREVTTFYYIKGLIEMAWMLILLRMPLKFLSKKCRTLSKKSKNLPTNIAIPMNGTLTRCPYYNSLIIFNIQNIPTKLIFSWLIGTNKKHPIF